MPPQCVKCADAAEARVHLDSGPRCLACLCSFLATKFAKALGRAAASGPRAQLAVGLSGGASSAALAYLAVAYVRGIRRRPGHAAPQVTLLHYGDGDGGGRARDAVQSICSALPGATLRVLEPVPERDAPALRDADDLYMMRAVGRMRALRSAAEECGAKTLLLGVSATRQAELMLSGVCSGRPAVHLDGAVTPLSDCRVRHLVRYARHVLPDVFVNAPVRAPIVTVVTRFVATVERDNASAVHNVVRTAARLLVPEGPRCALCDAPMRASGEKDAPAAYASSDEGGCGANGDGGCEVEGCTSMSNGMNDGVVCEVVPNGDGDGDGVRSNVNDVDDETLLCAACEAIVSRAEKKGVAQRDQLLRSTRGGI